MNGYHGRILRVDLTGGTTETFEPEPSLYHDYLGGSGLAARLFFDMGAWNADPLGPDNPLMIMHGPIAGTTLPGCSRLEICARSPQTGIWGESSMGGHVSPQFRGSGYDGIIITGASDKPVYLWVSDEGVEIRDAKGLWGKDTFETEEAIREELGDKRVKVMSIGPAGENLVKYAAIVNDRGSLAGRTGMGAVMGSKKLKAVAFRGSARTPIADEAAFKDVKQRATHNIKTSVTGEGLHAYGSNVHMEMGMAISDVPVKNWREAQWEEGMDALSGVTVAETIMTKTHSCYACPVSCKRIVKIDAGPYKMEEGPGLEYEGAASLGILQRCDNLEAVSRANELTDRLGMDCISAGSTIAWATEAYREGLITKEQTGGVELRWNDPDLLIRLIEMIATREGFGDELAEGCRALSDKYGGEEFAIHVKGLEAPMHDPRALWGMSLTYATGIRGACHVNDDNLMAELGNVSFREIGVKATKPHRAEGKAAQTVAAQTYGQLAGSAVVCLYAWWSMDGIQILRDMLNAVTGAGYSTDELLRIGNRAWYLKRAIGNLCGARKEDDVLPERVLLPHVEGLTSNLTKVLFPLMASMTRTKIRNEKIAGLLQQFSDRIMLPNTFKIITITGKLVPWIGGTYKQLRKSDVEQFRTRLVDFDYMLRDFYRLRDLDQRGFPSRERLEEYGLADVADELEKVKD
ncbi:MAG: aldehyde ferredoxin oxidoreductase family protein [Actinobacteria bacterium]|nr:aldehyde ferredoxin oxidoreductase family protein [Actinomycetota bacterium]MBU1942983.1 aldehyde ferredoxin oxidoreductase family protein [Actinomycetota bacterium]MBU2687776.1 aldehyde ferredoxin oxidoreductase family protein [Actinomycetota bacterium]